MQTFFEENQIKENEKLIYKTRGSLYPMFDTAKFNCIFLL